MEWGLPVLELHKHHRTETDITELVVEENAVDSDVDEVMDWVFGEESTDTESELDM